MSNFDLGIDSETIRCSTLHQEEWHDTNAPYTAARKDQGHYALLVEGMPSAYSSSRSSAASGQSGYSGSSRHTYSTTKTSYSDAPSQRRPSVKYHNTCPGRFGGFVQDPFSYDHEGIGASPRSSVETYASTVASAEDLDDHSEYELPGEREQLSGSDAIPTTPPDFAKLFPTTRRILIQHDDSSSDGNMNLRIDTEAVSTAGEKLKMTLFHLRIKNLHERQFSLRRYCRDSGREVCNSKKKYAKPAPKAIVHRKRPSLQRSMTSAFHMGKKSPRRTNSGYESDDEADDVEAELRAFTLNSEVEATIPTNTVRLEFSNYAQVEVHRQRQDRVKQYDFEYWGEAYHWRRERSVEDGETVFSYELIRLRTGNCIAYIMPDKLDGRQSRVETAQGSWVPPSSMRITEEISQDLGDVVVATGLIALTDDCIKRRWHSTHSARIHIPSVGCMDYVEPHKVADVVFRKQTAAARG